MTMAKFKIKKKAQLSSSIVCASEKKNKYIRVIYAHQNKMENMSTV